MQPMVYDPQPAELQHTTAAEIEALRDALFAIRKDIAFLHVLPLPYTEEQARLVEKATITQRKCKQWYEERKYRITASNFGLVAKRKRNHCALAKQLLYKRANLSEAAVMWGQQHEIDAIRAYKKSLKPKLFVEEVGIFVSYCGFLGASPDGVVCSGERLIEVKCPYRARQGTVREMCSNDAFCCSLDSNLQPRLKDTHDYYFQIQGQMAVTKIHVCDFIIWTPNDITVEAITFNEKFWIEKCYPYLKKFYFDLVLPEIIYPKYPEVPVITHHLISILIINKRMC
jgi:hypothetical protein